MELGIAALEYIERLRTMNDPDEIRADFEATLLRIGVTNFALVEFSLNPQKFKNRVIDDRMPEGWKQRYFEQRYVERDPVMTEVMTNVEPFLWSDVLTKCYAQKPQRRIIEEASEFQLNEGICIPIFGPKGYVALVTLAGPYLDISPGVRAAVHMMALYTHNRLVKLVRPPKIPKRYLTKRELDCLHWVAEGKSDWEIGEILQISESTAHWYIENAKSKIGVSTRMQAVVGAISEGVLHI